MSANIHFKSNIGNLSVEQLNTQLTMMLLTDDNGNTKHKFGKEALHALYQYRTYIKESINGFYKTNEDADHKRDYIKYQLSEIDNFIENSDIESLAAYDL